MITDFASLQTAVSDQLNRSDLTAKIPLFVQLAEARFRRKLDDLDQDITATITFTAGTAPLPADFGELRDIAGDFTDNPVVYNIVSGEIQASPAITGDAQITYKKSLPALSNSVTTNWLLDRAPDAYLFGALIQAEFYGWNDERLPLIKSALDEMIEELRIDSEARRWGTVPLAPMVRRT